MQTSFILECTSICDIRTCRAVNEPPPPEIQLTRTPDPTTFTAVSSLPHSQSISLCPALCVCVCVCVCVCMCVSLLHTLCHKLEIIHLQCCLRVNSLKIPSDECVGVILDIFFDSTAKTLVIYREFWYFFRVFPTLFSQFISIFISLLHTFSMGVKIDARLRQERTVRLHYA